MAAGLSARIVTPFGEIFRGEIQSAILPGYEGKFQVLPGHADLVSILDIGPIRLDTTDAKKHWFACSGGYCEVKDNQLKIMVESAEAAENIDIKRAQAAHDRARQRLQEKTPDVDILRAQLALARALNRIRIAKLSREAH